MAFTTLVIADRKVSLRGKPVTCTFFYPRSGILSKIGSQGLQSHTFDLEHDLNDDQWKDTHDQLTIIAKNLSESWTLQNGANGWKLVKKAIRDSVKKR